MSGELVDPMYASRAFIAQRTARLTRIPRWRETSKVPYTESGGKHAEKGGDAASDGQ